MASSSQRTAARFGVYQNAAISSALATRVGAANLSRVLAAAACVLLTWAMLSLVFRKEAASIISGVLYLDHGYAKVVINVVRATLTVLFLAALSALCKVALSFDAAASRPSAQALQLTPRQQTLIGVKTPNRTPPPRSQTPSASSPTVMVPLHPSMSKTSRAGGSSPASWDRRTEPAHTPVHSSPATPLQVSSFPYVSPASSQELSFNPWATSFRKDGLGSVEELEEFLADVESKMVESTGKTPSTPQGVMRAVGAVASPSLMATPQPSAGTTSIRSIRLSPTAQSSGASPKKADGDLPFPFTVEQTIEGFRRLGVYPSIEQWRDGLRQWFSDVLLGPLVRKIDRSHLQVMEAASKLGCPIVISPIGGAKKDSGTGGSTAMEGSQEWHTAYAPDEDALIHQFRATLLNARNSSPAPSIFGLRTPQEIPYLQECLDAVTEHQRLRALVKGEWVKGLLPQSSVRADYTIQRLRELAEGTCVKNYEFAGTGEVYDKTTKRWSLELPTDAHLLVYLFCALLEHPQWMLHVDPTSYPSTQSGNDPLFVANLPQKERFPEKYVAVLSSAPPVLHVGACILAVGKQSPPVFALYWDKRLQFSLQGRTALWDAILLLCHRIKVAHGGVVRGVNLGGSAFNLLSVLEQRPPES